MPRRLLRLPPAAVPARLGHLKGHHAPRPIRLPADLRRHPPLAVAGAAAGAPPPPPLRRGLLPLQPALPRLPAPPLCVGGRARLSAHDRLAVAARAAAHGQASARAGPLRADSGPARQALLRAVPGPAQHQRTHPRDCGARGARGARLQGAQLLPPTACAGAAKPPAPAHRRGPRPAPERHQAVLRRARARRGSADHHRHVGRRGGGVWRGVGLRRRDAAACL
mmetsp:Transcript_8829/g.25981  ORF Transcript_8829/g.25981 Transcript_8829/m.25981 type:complete len:223 (+) Transcript_8829:797-1465(+)